VHGAESSEIAPAVELMFQMALNQVGRKLGVQEFYLITFLDLWQ
jgi:hypothetical protein